MSYDYFIFSRTSDELDIDVESSRRIEYDGLRQVSHSEMLIECIEACSLYYKPGGSQASAYNSGFHNIN